MKTPIRFDEYYLVERIAVGGMAEVFKGITYSDEGFERVMAVKRVLPHIAEDHDFIEMFIDEAKLVSKLQHPNIPQVYHLGKYDQQFFISMEFISGQDIRAIFDRARLKGIKLDLGICAYIVMEVCEALDYAHRKTNEYQQPLNLIHRDVSPQNIILSYEGTVKLIDFGIAKAVGQINQTQAGILKGKFSYMSPEQARGYKIDARSDLFGLGAVLYELITLERCFLGQTDFSTIERVRNSEYKLPRKIRREIPAQLEKMIRKALAKDPNDRFQSAADFQEALRVFIRTHQLQRSREQVSHYICSIFAEEIESEKARMLTFRHYANEHIPQAQKHYDSRRFHSTSQAQIKEKSRPRFALDNEIKLSLEPQQAQVKGLDYQKRTSSHSSSRFPNSFIPGISRSVLLILLSILTGSLISAISWIKEPLESAIIFEDPLGLSATYQLNGSTAQFTGVVPDQILLKEAGQYDVVLSLTEQEHIKQTVQVQEGQILKISAIRDERQFNQIHNITSFPTGAQISTESMRLGTTPLTLYLKQKSTLIQVEAPNYQAKQVMIQANGQAELSHVKLKPLVTHLTLKTSIDEAEISIEEPINSKSWRILGRKQVQVSLNNLQSHHFQIKAEGYEDTDLTIEPSDLTHVQRWVILNPKSSVTPAQLNEEQLQFTKRFSSKVNQAVEEKINKEKIVEESPLQSVKEVKVKPKPKTEDQSLSQRSRSHVNKKSQRRSYSVKAKPKPLTQPGFLKLIAIPPAEVFIDGQSVGWTPLINHKLSEGSHQIKLRYQSGEEKTFKQNILAGRVALRRVKR